METDETTRENANPKEVTYSSGDAVIPEIFYQDKPTEEAIMPLKTSDIGYQKDQFLLVLAEAPELYGVNPTTQEIMEFREKEQAWRSKLKSL